MSSSWKDLIFVKEETKPGAKVTPTVPVTPSEDEQVSIVRGGRRGGSTSTASTVSINKKIHERLIQILDEANLEGPDYLEFMEAVKSMEDDVPDERKRFQLAYTSFKAMKVTPEKLTSAGDHYVKVLTTEKTKFVNTQNDKLGTITKNSKEITALKNSIKSAQDSIARWESELAQAESQSTKIQEEVDSKIAEFNISFDLIVEDIKENVEKIKNYIKG